MGTSSEVSISSDWKSDGILADMALRQAAKCCKNPRLSRISYAKNLIPKMIRFIGNLPYSECCLGKNMILDFP